MPRFCCNAGKELEFPGVTRRKETSSEGTLLGGVALSEPLGLMTKRTRFFLIVGRTNMDKKFSEPWLEPKPNAQLDSRPISAPPVLEVTKEPLALQLQKNQLENRTNDSHEASNEYDKFYESNQHLYPFLHSPLEEAVQSETPSPRKALFSVCVTVSKPLSTSFA